MTLCTNTAASTWHAAGTFSGVADGYAVKKHRHAAEVMRCASEIMIKQGRSLPVEYWADPF
jgi:hypothetical protein